jgi:hypothetical protein
MAEKPWKSSKLHWMHVLTYFTFIRYVKVLLKHVYLILNYEYTNIGCPWDKRQHVPHINIFFAFCVFWELTHVYMFETKKKGGSISYMIIILNY